jgi:hypothetical protein
MSRPFRVAAAVMGVAFTGFAAVQYNDSDWPVWVGVYGLATALSFAAGAGRGVRWPAGVLAVVTLVWAAPNLVQVAHVTVAEIFGSFTMKTLPIEEAREGLGLLIVGVWSALLAWKSRA